MSQYRDESHAVVRAVNAGEGRPKPAQWQDQYTSGYRESSPMDVDVLAGVDKLLGDSMTRALIRRSLSDPQWQVMLAVYSGNQADQVSAVDRLAGIVGTKAGPRNRRIWIGCWAVPALQLKYGKALIDWDGNATPDGTLKDWRNKIRKELDKHRADAFCHLRRVLADAGLIQLE